MSVLCVAVGWLIDPVWKMNKQLWSPSYLFFTAGCCGLLLVLLYLVYDLPVERPAGWLRALRLGFEPARWIGMNTIFICEEPPPPPPPPPRPRLGPASPHCAHSQCIAALRTV